MSSSRKARVPAQVLGSWSQGYIACLSLLGHTNLILFFSPQQSFHVMASKSNYKCKLCSYKNSFSQYLLRVGTYLCTIGRLSWPCPSILVGGSLTLGKSFVSRFLQFFTPVHVNNGFFCGWCEDHQPQYLWLRCLQMIMNHTKQKYDLVSSLSASVSKGRKTESDV